jgi:hypothetical protein
MKWTALSGIFCALWIILRSLEYSGPKRIKLLLVNTHFFIFFFINVGPVCFSSGSTSAFKAYCAKTHTSCVTYSQPHTTVDLSMLNVQVYPVPLFPQPAEPAIVLKSFPSCKSSIKLKKSVERWWNDTERGN